MSVPCSIEFIKRVGKRDKMRGLSSHAANMSLNAIREYKILAKICKLTESLQVN